MKTNNCFFVVFLPIRICTDSMLKSICRGQYLYFLDFSSYVNTDNEIHTPSPPMKSIINFDNINIEELMNNIPAPEQADI